MRRFEKAAGAGGSHLTVNIIERGHAGQNEQQVGDGNAAVVERFALTYDSPSSFPMFHSTTS